MSLQSKEYGVFVDTCDERSSLHVRMFFHFNHSILTVLIHGLELRSFHNSHWWSSMKTTHPWLNEVVHISVNPDEKQDDICV